MANILVTGGAGYIGSHVCKSLKQAGHTPISFDNLSRGFAYAVKWGPLIEGDIRNFQHLKETLIHQEIEAVVHLAAFAYVAESVDQPQLYFENNVTGLALLLSAMNEVGVKKILFSSSCATYGESLEKWITEAHAQKPINPYGLSKLVGEQMLLKFKEHHDFNFCGLRYFNAAGSDPEYEIGENHEPEPHLIPVFLKRAQEGKDFIINGNNYPTTDGTCVRDFIHVTDLAKAHVLALEKNLNSKTENNFYNVGLGKGYSLKEVAEEVIALTNSNSKITYGPKRSGDPAHLVCDASRFKKEFQWIPNHPTLKEMLKTTLKWQQINSRNPGHNS